MLRYIATIALALAPSIALASGGSAQNVIPATGAFSWLSAGETLARLTLYADASCDLECPDIRLTCETPRTLDIRVFGFSRADIADWIAAEDPFAGVAAEMNFLFNIDDIVTPFIVWSLDLNDFDGAWIARGFVYGDPMIALLESFARSDFAAIETPPRTIALASRPEDLANRAAFADACLAM